MFYISVRKNTLTHHAGIPLMLFNRPCSDVAQLGAVLPTSTPNTTQGHQTKVGEARHRCEHGWRTFLLGTLKLDTDASVDGERSSLGL